MSAATLPKQSSVTYRKEPTATEMQKEMREFANRLQKNPDQAKDFLQRAGILNAKGKLSTPYK